MTVSAIESVTIGVEEIGSATKFFEDELGLAVVSSGRASVGLLAAWRHPVHEAVRLIELAGNTPDSVHVRLAQFEDASERPASGAGTPFHAPRMLDFRAGPPSIGACQLRSGPAGVPVIVPGRAAPDAHPRGQGAGVSWVWLGVENIERARRFYAEALAYEPVALDGAQADGGPLRELLGVSASQVLPLRAPSASAGGVILFQNGTGHATPTHERARLPRTGIGLLSCRCVDLDDLVERLEALDVEPLAAPTHVGLPQGYPGRVMVVRGPGSELLEFVQLED